MIRRLAAVFAALALATTALVGTAAPAQAAASRWVSKTTYDSRGFPITVDISTADYGSYERVNRIKFRWTGQGMQSLYPQSDEFGVRLREGGYGGPIVWSTRTRWYYDSPKELNQLICHEPCNLSAQLHVEISLWPDSYMNIFGFAF